VHLVSDVHVVCWLGEATHCYWVGRVEHLEWLVGAKIFINKFLVRNVYWFEGVGDEETINVDHVW